MQLKLFDIISELISYYETIRKTDKTELLLPARLNRVADIVPGCTAIDSVEQDVA